MASQQQQWRSEEEYMAAMQAQSAAKQRSAAPNVGATQRGAYVPQQQVSQQQQQASGGNQWVDEALPTDYMPQQSPQVRGQERYVPAPSEYGQRQVPQQQVQQQVPVQQIPQRDVLRGSQAPKAAKRPATPPADSGSDDDDHAELDSARLRKMGHWMLKKAALMEAYDATQ